MSKYDPLTHHLATRRTEQVPMSFTAIERLLGFDLPHSAHVHRAWWSNNPSNNVMTKAWLKAGYRTEDVDLNDRRLVFRREAPPPGPSAPPPAELVDKVDHPAFGSMRGTVTIAPGVDLTAPADPEWADIADAADI